MDAKSIISLFLLGVIQKVRSLRRGGGGVIENRIKMTRGRGNES